MKLQMNALSNNGQLKLSLAARRVCTLQSHMTGEGNEKGEAIAQSKTSRRTTEFREIQVQRHNIMGPHMLENLEIFKFRNFYKCNIVCIISIG